MKKLGIYQIGVREVEVWTEELSGNGSFDSNQLMVRVVIGLQHPQWWQCLDVALHEALELILSDLNCRYVPDMSYSDSADEYIFHCNHPQFSEAMGRLGQFMSSIMPPLADAYAKLQKKRSKKL